MRRPGFQHRQHARQGAGSRGMFGKLSIAFVVLVICTLSFLFLSTLSSGGRESSSPSEIIVDKLWETAASGGWRPSSAPRSDWPLLLWQLLQANLMATCVFAVMVD